MTILRALFLQIRTLFEISEKGQGRPPPPAPSNFVTDHVVVLVFIDFPSNSKCYVLFNRIAYDYSTADWGSLCDLLRDAPWEDIFKLSASAAANEFCE